MKLREWRKTEGLTSKELGARCGVSEAAIRHYETGERRPRPEIARRIEAATGGAVSAAQLLGISGVSSASSPGLLEGAATFAHGAVDADVFAEAISYGLNPAEIARAAVERAVKTERMKRFSAENRDAIESWNDLVEREGLWSDGLRAF